MNAAEADGTTALHWAADGDNPGLVELLVRAGANVKAANRYGVTPLWLACMNGNAATVELLLKAGADPNTVLPEGETVLMTAARTGKVDAVKVLLEAGAAVNAKEGWHGQTALMWAAAEGHPAVIQVLVGARRRHPRAFERRIHGAAVCRPRGTGRRRPGAAERGSEPERRAAGAGAARRRAPGPKPASTRSCWPPRTRTTSWPRGCWTGAPIRTPPLRDGRRCTRCRGCARPASPGATTRPRKAPATWTASSSSGSSWPKEPR